MTENVCADKHHGVNIIVTMRTYKLSTPLQAYTIPLAHRSITERTYKPKLSAVVLAVIARG